MNKTNGDQRSPVGLAKSDLDRAMGSNGKNRFVKNVLMLEIGGSRHLRSILICSAREEFIDLVTALPAFVIRSPEKSSHKISRGVAVKKFGDFHCNWFLRLYAAHNTATRTAGLIING